MQEEQEKLNSLYQRYSRLAIISLFLMALLQGLHSFFLTIFFWLSAGFGALALNYFIAAKREAEPNVSWQRQSSSPQSIQNNKALFVVIVSLTFGFIIFFAFIINMSSSSNDTEESETQTEQAQDKSTEKTTEPT